MGAALSFGMPLLKSVLEPRYVCTLWRTGSPFLAWIFWPTTAVVIRGSYMQSFWSISTVVSGALAVSFAPLVTCTQTFSSFPPFTETAGSVMGFLAQKGSASRCSLPGVGALPVKSTVPSMDSAIAAAGMNKAAAIATAKAREQVISDPLGDMSALRLANASCGVKAWTAQEARLFNRAGG